MAATVPRMWRVRGGGVTRSLSPCSSSRLRNGSSRFSMAPTRSAAGSDRWRRRCRPPRLAERRPDAVSTSASRERTVEPLTLVLGIDAVYCDVTTRGRRCRASSTSSRTRRCSTRARRGCPRRTCSRSARRQVGGTTSCEVEAMEGFGVLRACALAGVPAVELRVVANSPDEPDRAKWRIDDALGVLARDARASRRPLGTRRCRARSARRRRRRGSPRRFRSASGAVCPCGRPRLRPARHRRARTARRGASSACP